MFTYCLSLSLFIGTPMAAETPKECLKLTAYEIASQYNLDPDLFIAIVEHESRWKVNAVNTKSRDYGLTQISYKNIEALGLSKERLLTDPEYALREGAKVLSYMHRRFKHEPTWFCRYNVGTVKTLTGTLAGKCLKYASKISKELNKLNVARKD